jgi:hypothetical protein
MWDQISKTAVDIGAAIKVVSDQTALPYPLL